MSRLTKPNKPEALVEMIGAQEVLNILADVHEDAVYYVHKWTNNFGGRLGYCTDKFFLELDDGRYFFRLDKLRRHMNEIEQMTN